jgi:hypothetical protein
MRCYGYSAAEAERNPRSEAVQASVFAYQFLVELSLAPEKPRPSETEALLSSQRRIAAAKLDDPNFKAERDECSALLGGNPAGEMGRLVAKVLQ